MKMLTWAGLILAIVVACESTTDTPAAQTKTLEERMKQMEDVLGSVSRQLMLQQFYAEETIRSNGDSGLVNIRKTMDGTTNYFQPSYTNGGFMSQHNHANYDRTVGLGELSVVLNGFKFRTRHNDYKLKMPSRTSTDYGATESIEFPPIPESVLNQTSVEEQIIEMRKYFEAFKTQDVFLRDYRPYFRPVLCYLEGAWTLSKGAIDEPFDSDRHFIDADSWFDLMDKARFTAYTGSKSLDENFAVLPTTIYDVVNGIPQFAQWNYRIVCHPIKGDLPLKHLKLDNDLAIRFPHKFGLDRFDLSDKARYHLNDREFDHHTTGEGLLDNLMREIPGKDNYPANLTGDSLGLVLTDIRFSNNTVLNTGYYHRYMRSLRKDAMGSSTIHRGFSDSYLFVAETSQDKVAPMRVKSCKKKGKTTTCKQWTARYTYAIPLEIIYLTPLYTWNPYNVSIGTGRSLPRYPGRYGGRTTETAYPGAHTRGRYYLTPAEFHDNRGKKPGFLDGEGKVRSLAPSGTVKSMSIPDVGVVKLRYPIVPLYAEGNPAFEELNALKKITMQLGRYSKYLIDPVTGAEGDEEDNIYYYETTESTRIVATHRHTFFVTADQMKSMKDHKTVTVETSQDVGHTHILQLRINNDRVYISKCDGANWCFDGHTRKVYRV